jgi:hypothetical protein
MIVDERIAPVHQDPDGIHNLQLSDAGCLSQFGAYRGTLPPAIRLTGRPSILSLARACTIRSAITPVSTFIIRAAMGCGSCRTRTEPPIPAVPKEHENE